ncbi:hypothetical protein FO519_009194 [Halicephalobus sp. NKZ332]|nr:hypothetical protein FO519_009194 [Halicephalobus sp. NKZ332]
MIPSNYIPTEVQNIPITISAEQATILAAQLQGQSSMLQVNNSVQINPDQAYVVSVNGELHYPVATSNVPGAPLALVPLGQHVNMDWLSMQTSQGTQQQYIQPEVQVAYQISPENISFVQEVPVASTATPVPTTSNVQVPQTMSSKSISSIQDISVVPGASGSDTVTVQNPQKKPQKIMPSFKEVPGGPCSSNFPHQSSPMKTSRNTNFVKETPSTSSDVAAAQNPSTRSPKKPKSPQKPPSEIAIKMETEYFVERTQKNEEKEKSDSPTENDPQNSNEESFSSRNSPSDFDDDDEAKILADEMSGLHERIMKLIEDSKDDPIMNFQKRLKEGSSLKKFIDFMPKLNYEKFSQLVNQVLKPVIHAIPNAIINGVGPTVHECGSLFNFKTSENSRSPEFVWFNFSLSVLIGDKRSKRLIPFTEDQLGNLILKLKETVEKSNSFKSAVVRGQRSSKKLVLELANANAKAILLFNTPVALKRSFLIRTYQRLDSRLSGLVYLFSIFIQNNPEMALISNNPLCHLLIFFLQKSGYVEILHKKIPEKMKDVDVFALTDIDDAELSNYINKKKSDVTVTRLVYECSIFYSTFDFENHAIDITRGEPCLRREIEWKNKFRNDPIVIPCAYSQTNLASAVTKHCFRTFLNGLVKLVGSFETGNESLLFENNLIEIARQQGEIPVL